MINVAAEGWLLLPLYEWIDELSCGWRDETKIADAGDTSKAAESPSHANNYNSTDVEKGNKGKAAESASLVETHETSGINAVDNRQAVKPVPFFTAHYHKSTSADAPDKIQPTMAPKKP